MVTRAQQMVGPISGSGSFTEPGAAAMPGCASGHVLDAIDLPVFAVHDCELSIDLDTGHVRVLAYRVVQDVGRAINPRAILGQIQGGVVQGLGYALHEEVTIGNQGKCASGTSRATASHSRATSCRCRWTCSKAPLLGPLGIKGAGEVPL